ncbi:hypothetical protein [Stenotrophomonas maltophilia]|uniref:hypothetical protein n=1 Tax=Stenotrophomonas maltophilia TaxID=40324 RepID=UPI003BF7BBF3
MTTDNKTLAVDVLAILDDAEWVLRMDHYKAIPDDLVQARAAVAELIEALDLAAYGEYLPESVEQQIRTSLARVRGESA